MAMCDVNKYIILSGKNPLDFAGHYVTVIKLRMGVKKKMSLMNNTLAIWLLYPSFSTVVYLDFTNNYNTRLLNDFETMAIVNLIYSIFS